MRRRRRIISVGLLACAAVLPISGCSSRHKFDAFDTYVSREQRADETILEFQRIDPGLQKFFERSYGYCVFPRVTKAGVGIGGARGNGVVYEQGRVIGWARLTQVTVGLQLGTQVYSEAIFFQDKASLDHFRDDHLEFDAQASAVAATSGSSANASYADGVLIFTLAQGGLMLEASIGGQRFDFVPKY
jgi:lipid-binding SYLF domain-containing protein